MGVYLFTYLLIYNVPGRTNKYRMPPLPQMIQDVVHGSANGILLVGRYFVQNDNGRGADDRCYEVESLLVAGHQSAD